MAEHTPLLSISFVSLLESICSKLELPPPMYQCVDMVKNVSYVTIPYAPPIGYSLCGDASNTEAASCESAAKKMALHLVRTRNLMVVDANHAARVEAEQSAQHYGIKRSTLERIEKGSLPITKYEIVPIEGIDYGKICIEIDFLALLRKAVDRFQIAITPIDVNELSDGAFQSWFSVTVPRSLTGKKYIVGDRCPSASMAKQSVAKKDVALLMALHHFEVEDINYHFLKIGNLVSDLERESFLTIRERVHGLDEEKEPRPLVIEQDLLTPKGEANQIVVASSPPLPPKKRRLLQCSPSFSGVIPDSSIISEFTLLKQSFADQ